MVTMVVHDTGRASNRLAEASYSRETQQRG